jgi:uncharacterized protein YjbI with pentapeptide repeats
MVVYAAVVPQLRQQKYDQAWATVRAKGAGTREALEMLTEGCWKKEIFDRRIAEVLTPFYGNCANLGKVDLSNTNLSSANLIGAYLNGANLRNTDFVGTALSGASLNGTDLSGAKLNADLTNAALSGANLYSADLGSAYLDGADLGGANLRDADLVLANLRGANLGHTDLSGANLSSVNLRNADLSNANLSRADLTCEEVVQGITQFTSCTDFRGAKNLTPEQVKAAKNWEQAIYDPAFCQQLGLKDCKTKQAGE